MADFNEEKLCEVKSLVRRKAEVGEIVYYNNEFYEMKREWVEGKWHGINIDKNAIEEKQEEIIDEGTYWVAKFERDNSIKFNIDVSDALKGIKALKRESRELLQILKEIESKNFKISNDSDVVGEHNWDKCNSEEFAKEFVKYINQNGK
jgi:hypothetical protein